MKVVQEPKSAQVSVIVPAFNAGKFIHQTITSALQQSIDSLELIIVDDGSTDDTVAKIKQLSDPRITLIQQANNGVSVARNRGIESAKGEFIAFLDADDLYCYNNLEEKIAFLKAYPNIGLVHSAEQYFSADALEDVKHQNFSRGVGGEVLHHLLTFNKAVLNSPSSVVLRASLLKKVGGFDEKLSTSADWDLWVRLAKETEFGYLDEPLVQYRVHDQQMHRNIALMEKDMLYAFHKHFQNGTFYSHQFYKFCQAKLYLILSACYMGDARMPGKAFKLLLKSFLTNPKPGFQYFRDRFIK